MVMVGNTKSSTIIQIPAMSSYAGFAPRISAPFNGSRGYTTLITFLMTSLRAELLDIGRGVYGEI